MRTVLLPEDRGRRPDSVIERFDEAWQGGRRPELAEFVPADNRVPVLLKLIPFDLEYRLRAGDDARAEEYLREYPELVGRAAVQVVEAEYQARVWADRTAAATRTEEPARTEPRATFLDRFPALRNDLF
jgi:hypothetical protein